jgi:tetratricopeptide (TPR) repeat protein
MNLHTVNNNNDNVLWFDLVSSYLSAIMSAKAPSSPPPSIRATTTTTNNTPEAMKEKGNEHFKNENCKEALECYSEAIELDWSNRSATMHHFKDLELAVEDTDECIRLEPRFGKRCICKAAALIALGKPEAVSGSYWPGLCKVLTDTERNHIRHLKEKNDESLKKKSNERHEDKKSILGEYKLRNTKRLYYKAIVFSLIKASDCFHFLACSVLGSGNRRKRNDKK